MLVAPETGNEYVALAAGIADLTASIISVSSGDAKKAERAAKAIRDAELAKLEQAKLQHEQAMAALQLQQQMLMGAQKPAAQAPPGATTSTPMNWTPIALAGAAVVGAVLLARRKAVRT